MVRPRHFMPNADTAHDNEFQRRPPPNGFAAAVAAQAARELTAAAGVLRSAGVDVLVFDDGETDTPDSVFPNNWISTHPDGRIALYPLLSPRRRPERRTDVLAALCAAFDVREIVDYSGYEREGRFLEGTGALVFDHAARVAYATISRRADRELIDIVCADFAYEPMVFHAASDSGRPIYHTNVMLCVASRFAVAGLALITDPSARDAVRQRLQASGRAIVDLTMEQVAGFAANAIELQGAGGPIFVLSTTAYRCLRPDQIRLIEASATIVPLEIPTIELSGGSARCVIADVQLPVRRPAAPVHEGRR